MSDENGIVWESQRPVYELRRVLVAHEGCLRELMVKVTSATISESYEKATPADLLAAGYVPASELATMREERDEARRDEAAMRMAAQMVADDHRRLWPLVSAVRNAESVLRDVAKNYGPPEVKALLAVFDALYDQPTTSAAENQAKLVAALSADTAKTGGGG